MAKFLITYHGSGHPDPAEMEQARTAFMAWLTEQGSAVIDPGAPLNFVGQVAASDPAPVSEIAGYSIIEAPDANAAAAILATHPFVSRGGTLQISQALGA